VTRRIALVIGALSLTCVPAARAQGSAKPGDERSRGETRREAFRVIDAYVVSNLQESLGLSDADFVKVLPLVRKLQTGRREYLLERARLLRQLRRQLRSGSAGEAEVRQTLEALKSVETSGPERARRDAAELDAALTPLQQAKYRVLELEVEQRLRELMGRARERGTAERTPHE
jgi:hypothetical protein